MSTIVYKSIIDSEWLWSNSEKYSQQSSLTQRRHMVSNMDKPRRQVSWILSDTIHNYSGKCVAVHWVYTPQLYDVFN